MIATEYRPHKRLNSAPHLINVGEGMVKVRILDVERPVKVTATIINFLVHFVLLILIAASPVGVLIASVAAAALTTTSLFVLHGIWRYVNADFVLPESRGIDDEIKGVRETYERLCDMRSMMPEGSGWIERIDEYGRIAYQMFVEIDRLPRDLSARQATAYKVKNEIQVEMQKLINTGNELIDLIATQRTENTKQAISHLGIDAYAEHVSVATAAHRALSSGE